MACSGSSIGRRFKDFINGRAVKIDYYPRVLGEYDVETDEVTLAEPTQFLDTNAMVLWDQAEPKGSDLQIDRRRIVLVLAADELDITPSTGDRFEYPAASDRGDDAYLSLTVYQVDRIADAGSVYAYGLRAAD